MGLVLEFLSYLRMGVDRLQVPLSIVLLSAVSCPPALVALWLLEYQLPSLPRPSLHHSLTAQELGFGSPRIRVSTRVKKRRTPPTDRTDLHWPWGAKLACGVLGCRLRTDAACAFSCVTEMTEEAAQT